MWINKKRNKGKHSHCKILFIKKLLKEIINKSTIIARNSNTPFSETDRTTKTTITKNWQGIED